MKVIVLGAGIIGTASAWFLQKAGHEVTVIARQPGAAQETSFANGCQISVSHAEPWANPSAPLKLLKWLGKEDAPLLFRLRADWLQWRWGMSFLRECTPARAAHNIRQIVAIAEYSRQTLQSVRAETGIAYDAEKRGILHFYTDDDEFQASLPAAQLMRELGCPRQTIDADEVVRIEPALAAARTRSSAATSPRPMNRATSTSSPRASRRNARKRACAFASTPPSRAWSPKAAARRRALPASK
mgnify:CR=1 FL=1